MRIAVAAEDSRGLESVVAHHFGRAPYYVFVDVEGTEVQGIEVLPNPYAGAHQPGQIPAFINEQRADAMVSGGMGRRAVDLFQQYGISAHTGATGTVKEAVGQVQGGALGMAEPCAHEDHDHECQ